MIKRMLTPARRCFLCTLLLFGLVSCTPSASQESAAYTPSATAADTLTPLPSLTAPAPTAPPTATPPAANPSTKTSLCSPLENITLEQLPEIVSNPFAPPARGLDDGHHGVDLGFYRFGDRVGMRGWPVLSALMGKVAGVIFDRPPYGNAIIIETPLDNLPSEWLARLQIPDPLPTPIPSAALSCPTATPAISFTSAKGRSLYILYAHFDQSPTLKTGDAVTCGQPIGAAGTSGMSVNEHLHFEVRVGTSGATFSSMAHYDTRATPEEMAAYCTWRISGQFQLIDPMKLLSIRP